MINRCIKSSKKVEEALINNHTLYWIMLLITAAGETGFGPVMLQVSSATNLDPAALNPPYTHLNSPSCDPEPANW